MNGMATGGGAGGLSRWVPPGGEERLRMVLAAAREGSAVWRERLDAADIGFDGAGVGFEGTGGAAWLALPVLRKESLGSVQAESPPFGGLLGKPVKTWRGSS